MERKLAKVSSKGHVIIPKSLRKKLNINTGDYVQIVLENGFLKISPAKSEAERLAGVLRDKVDGEIDFNQVREKIAEEVARDASRKTN